MEIVSERLDERDAREGFILDGVPRNVIQAQMLGEALEEKGMVIDAVIEIVACYILCPTHLPGRTNYVKCGKGYHKEFNLPEREGVCDAFGSFKIRLRLAHSDETVRNRLKIYHGQTEPLVQYYDKLGILQKVDGMADIDEVTKQIEKALS